MTTGESFGRQPASLRANGFLYDAGVGWVEAGQSSPDRCLKAIWEVGHLAWNHHPGRFADGALENPAFRLGTAKYGQNFSKSLDLAPAGNGRLSRSLHVVTEVHPVGGHTRVVAKWALRDPDSTATVVLTRQTAPVPEFFERVINEAKGKIIRLPVSESDFARAGRLREISRQCDRVILHTHPNDPIPVLAFAVAGGPPVAMFNHAHFSFCLASTVSDIIINTMDYFRGITEKFRFPRHTALVCGTPGLKSLEATPVDKEAAKEALGLGGATPVILSIAAERYFTPMEGYNFFLTAAKLLKRNPSVHLLVVGVRSNSPLITPELRGEVRMRCVGPVVDPFPYYRAADICLESFPMPSLGALAEAAAYGEAFPVPVYGPDQNILRVSQAPALTYAYRPKDEEDYLAYIESLLRRKMETREAAHELRLSMVRLEQSLGERHIKLNRSIDGLQHEPSEIPRVPLNSCADCRTLAALNPADLAVVLGAFPLGRATRARLAAVTQGLSSPRKNAGQFARQVWGGLSRRLRLAS